MTAEEEESFGYCTQFVLTGENLDPDKLRKDLKDKGQSLIVIGEGSTIRVHIHTLDPDSVIRYATSLGTLHDINIGNMDEQHQDFLMMKKEKMLPVDIAIVAVVAGKGLADVFMSVGVSAIVSGGQTMNPSTKDILQAVEAVPSDEVIILPNNKNIVLTAQQVQSLTNKSIKVVPVETIPQGVAALLAVNYQSSIETNSRLMAKAKSTVKTIEITRATRSTNLDGLDIKKNQAIGLLDGKLSAAGDESSDVISDLLTKIDLAEAELITIYYGADTEEAEAEDVSARISKQHPQLQVEVVNGGQPHYDYIIGIE
jgi:DAK2 domain fusion protein YloV